MPNRQLNCLTSSFFETGSLTAPGTGLFGWAGWPASLRSLPACPPALRPYTHTAMLGSYVGAGDPNSSAACEALALPTASCVQPFSAFVTSIHSVAQAGLELATRSSPPASTSQMLELQAFATRSELSALSITRYF